VISFDDVLVDMHFRFHFSALPPATCLADPTIRIIPCLRRTPLELAGAAGAIRFAALGCLRTLLDLAGHGLLQFGAGLAVVGPDAFGRHTGAFSFAVVAALAGCPGYRFRHYFRFLAVFADCRNAFAEGAPLAPGFRIFSLDPAAIRRRFRAMLA